MPLTNSQTFAGYTIIRLLGAGGMGEVYLVQHPRLPRQEALKVLRPEFSRNASFRERFIREADLAAGLRHPHVVGIHDRGEHDGQLWIAMDYIEGTDLSHLLELRYPAGMPVGHVITITTAVASALDYAHKKGLLHRDVKPANIIVADLDTDDPSVFVADFGIARPLDDTSGITTTNMTVGTVAYAAPEQLMGEPIDGRADQYALAATIYHLLTGAQLFPHSNPAVVISRHLNAPAPALTDIRPELAPLAPVLAAALAKNPDHRFACCTDFARAVTETAAPQTLRVVAAPTTPAPAARRHYVSPPLSKTDGASTAQGDSASSVTRWLIVVSVALRGAWSWRTTRSAR
jgi:serine/threonine protein kinase, bacterial